MASSSKSDKKSKCIEQCSPADYKAAVRVAKRLGFAINLASLDPARTATEFTAQFAPDGVWSHTTNPISPPGNILGLPANTYGLAKILAANQAYLSDPGEINQSVSHRTYVWDCTKRTLLVEQSWFAALTTPRTFVYGESPIVGGVGFGYDQDDLVLLQFDCDYKLVVYREFFNSAQFVSTYTDAYPDVCKIKCTSKKGPRGGCKGCKGCAEIPACTDCDRDRANYIYDKAVFAQTLLPFDPNLGSDLFAALFADCGVLSTAINPDTLPYAYPPQANFYGPRQIADFVKAQALSTDVTNASSTTSAVYWDCIARSLVAISVYTATLTADRYFGSTLLPAGTTFSQDRATIIRFDCDYKIVYFREYFDTAQYEATYPTVVAPVCSKFCDCKSCEKCFRRAEPEAPNCGKPCDGVACACLNPCGSARTGKVACTRCAKD